MTGKLPRLFSIILIIGLLMLSSMASFAQQTQKATLVIDSTNLQLGVSANLSLVLTDVNKAEITGMTGIENFDIVSTSQSSSTQIVNGKTSKQKQVTYTIMPKQAGTFDLTATVKVDGVEATTNTLTLTVSEDKQTTGASNGAAQDLFIKTVVSKEKAYIGEKVLVTYELYSRYNIDQYGFLDNVTFKNALMEEVPQDNLQANLVMIDGNQYAKYEAKQLILTPIQAGKLEIPSFKFQANISDGSIFSQTQEKYLQSDATQIDVEAVPNANQPAGYTGLVGNITLEANYDQTEVAYGQPVTLHVKATGDANLDVIDQFVNEADIANFSVYETDQPLQNSYANQTYQGTRESEIIFVPKEVGDLTIVPKPIAYFDTQSGTYKELQLPQTTIHVTGEKPGSGAGSAPGNSDVGTVPIEKVVIQQVQYAEAVESSDVITIKKADIVKGIIGLFLMVMVVIAIVIYSKKKKQVGDDYKNSLQEINKASTLSDQYEAFNEFIKLKYGLSLKSCTRGNLSTAIQDPTILEKLYEIVDYMERGRFTSEGNTINIKDKMISFIKTHK